LLIGSRSMVRMHNGRFTTFVPPDPVARFNVFDAMEDSSGTIWLATPGGLGELRGDRFRIVASGGPILASAFVTLAEGPAGVIWAGTHSKGLYRIQGGEVRLFTTADGLSSDQIRSLYSDPDGNLWIGTFGGGLNLFHDGKFTAFGARDGLLSDNIASISSDGESLWLSTTRGICRISIQQLRDFMGGRRKVLEPVNYGVEDGLRSTQCAPSFPVGSGGTRTDDGRVWFTTSRGLAVYNPTVPPAAQLAPAVHLVELSVDGQPVDLDRNRQLGPNSQRVQLRYAAIHFSAPEQVRYSYRLSGVDSQWVRAGPRRTINYNTLAPGGYVFAVRAEIAGGPAAERSFAFEVLPRFYESWWFRLLAVIAVIAAAWAVYQFRLRQIRYGFALVLEERARLAREIHDTLAQGFVGISSQLDAVAMCMPQETSPARKFLDLARRMARHSLTEARRSVMDLRASALEGQDLAAALESGTRMWTAGSGIEVDVDASSPATPLPEEMEQHLLRIAQEAVTNVVKHAGATRIAIRLHIEAHKLFLQIKDNGRGFEPRDVFASAGGHFGILGMRERAERLGGDFKVESHPGEGTEVEVRTTLQ
jgi:signal transduction histidine kinase